MRKVRLLARQFTRDAMHSNQRKGPTHALCWVTRVGSSSEATGMLEDPHLHASRAFEGARSGNSAVRCNMIQETLCAALETGNATDARNAAQQGIFLSPRGGQWQ